MDLCEKIQPKSEPVALAVGLEVSAVQTPKQELAVTTLGTDGIRTKRERQREILRRWRKNNPDKALAQSRRHSKKRTEWARQHAERRREIALRSYYRTKPPPKQRVLANTACAIKSRNRRKMSVQVCIGDRLRASLSRALRRRYVRKSLRTMQLVGCSLEALKAHLESQFKDGMSWDTRNSWHVDHIVPIAAFDLTNLEEQLIAFNWKNLRPLNGHDNHVKSDKVPDILPDWIPNIIAEKIRFRQSQRPR